MSRSVFRAFRSGRRVGVGCAIVGSRDPCAAWRDPQVCWISILNNTVIHLSNRKFGCEQISDSRSSYAFPCIVPIQTRVPIRIGGGLYVTLRGTSHGATVADFDATLETLDMWLARCALIPGRNVR